MCYETNENIYSEEYLKRLDIIENFRENTNYLQTKISDLLTEDIYNSIHIEGNSLTKREVTLYLEKGITVRGKPLRDYAQAKNYNNVIDKLKQNLFPKDLTEDLILAVHKMITDGEIPEAGMYRDDFVSLTTSLRIPPDAEEVPRLMQELVAKFNEPTDIPMFEKICEFKRNFELIHPFFDGNGRTGRVLMNNLFLQQGYPCIIIKAEERDEYFDSLENNYFCEFASKKMLESIMLLQKTNANKDRLLTFLNEGGLQDGVER